MSPIKLLYLGGPGRSERHNSGDHQTDQYQPDKYQEDEQPPEKAPSSAGGVHRRTGAIRSVPHMSGVGARVYVVRKDCGNGSTTVGAGSCLARHFPTTFGTSYQSHVHPPE
jgi:hypothetical protein